MAIDLQQVAFLNLQPAQTKCMGFVRLKGKLMPGTTYIPENVWLARSAAEPIAQAENARVESASTRTCVFPASGKLGKASSVTSPITPSGESGTASEKGLLQMVQ